MADATSRMSDAASNRDLSDDQRGSINTVHDFYGAPGESNGVVVKIGNKGSLEGASGGTITSDGRTEIGIRFNSILEKSDTTDSPRFRDRLAATLAHEGEHGVDQRINGMPTDRATEKSGEIRAATTEAAMFQGMNSNFGPWLWTPEHGLQPNGIEREAEHSTDLWCINKGGSC